MLPSARLDGRNAADRPLFCKSANVIEEFYHVNSMNVTEDKGRIGLTCRGWDARMPLEL